MKQKAEVETKLQKRALVQYLMGFGFIILNVILFFVWPTIAYIPLIIIPFMILSVFVWSRAFCGWVCPRAAFMERYFKYFSLKKRTPKWMNLWWISAIVFIVLIGRVTYVGFTKGALAAGFLLCIVPTIGALLFGWYSPKAWCAICPTGTLMKFVDRLTKKFRIKKNTCTSCRVCEKACPMSIEISKTPLNSNVDELNCTQCGLCVPACPTSSLDMPGSTGGTNVKSVGKFSA